MKQLFRICLPVKLADRRTSIKKEKVSSYIVYNFSSFSKMAGKTESFSGKISWIWTCSQISRKFSHWENLLLLWMMSNKASTYLYTLFNNHMVRIFTLTELSDKHLSVHSEQKQHLKKVWNLFKVNKNDTRTNVLLPLLLTFNIFPTFS